jgi:probable HAF family extracellular repeat protein
MLRLTRVPVLAACLLALALVGPAQASAQYPYTLVDPGTFGGPSSFLDLPGVPLTSNGTLIGTADTSTADSDFPNCPPPGGCYDPFIQHAFAWKDGRLTDLGALPGQNDSAIYDLNGHGVGTGTAENGLADPLTGTPASVAAMFQNGQVIDLGTLPGGHESLGQFIDDSGQVTGFGSNGIPDQYPSACFGFAPTWNTQVRTIVWQDGLMRDIGTLGGPDALMNAANSSGEIAGLSFTNSVVNPATGCPTLDPFLWANGHMRDLGGLGGAQGSANWLNNGGAVVGQSDLAGDQTAHAFLWNAGHMRDLGTLGGNFSAADYVSQSGDIAGWSTLPGDNSIDGVLWHSGRMVDLTPVGGAPFAFGNAVNDRGQVVGNENDASFNEIIAALWSGGHGYDLNTLVAPNPLQMISADYIDDRGDIVGHGVMPDGSQRMFLLIRNPSAPLPPATSSIASARRGRHSGHHPLSAAQDRSLVREFGSAARTWHRPAL